GRGAHGPATLAQIRAGDATIPLENPDPVQPQKETKEESAMPNIEFTGNYQDLSTDRGYQFKFYCEKCGNGYMSTFKSSKLGLAASAASVASNLLGGIFGRVSDTAYEIQRAVGGPAHDAALKEAVAEIRPLFKQCTRCGRWVCGPVCFNERAGLCEYCAPDMDEEIASAQAEAAKQQAFDKAQQ